MRQTPPPFVKSRPGLPAAAYAYEAASLRWLGEAEGGCPVAEVLDVAADRLVLGFIDACEPTLEAARAFGAALAATHQAGATAFGELPPGAEAAYLAGLPLPGGAWPAFGAFWAQARLAPFLRLAADGHDVTRAQAKAIERLIERLEREDSSVIGPAEEPSRIHGDLWSGNIMWRKRSCVLIDPAAHGGHRETDLAMLALFGIRHFDEIVAAYDDAYPLAPGWRHRLALHQVHPLLAHAVLFGGSYGAAAAAAAERALTG